MTAGNYNNNLIIIIIPIVIDVTLFFLSDVTPTAHPKGESQPVAWGPLGNSLSFNSLTVFVSTLETDLFFDTKPRPAGFNINLEIN